MKSSSPLLFLLLLRSSTSIFHDTGWTCPEFDLHSDCDVSCGCNFDHTIRCDGFCEVEHIVTDILTTLINHTDVSLLDLSLRNLTRLSASSLFLKMKSPPEALVVSTGVLSVVVPDTFIGLEGSLTSLSFTDNALRDIPSSLDSLKRLRQLDLSHNAITELLSRPVMTGLTSLRSLDVSYNSISKVDIRFSNLERIDLRGNKMDLDNLRSFMIIAARYLPVIEVIILAQNTRLDGMLNGSHFPFPIRSLTYLDLSESRIRGLAENSFAKFPNLRHLNLKSNRIVKISSETFRGLSRLNILDLSDNRIVRFQSDIDDSLSDLTRLNLKGNRISKVTSDMMIGSHLKVLNLEANVITNIESKSLDSLIDIYDLNLKDNPLKCDCELAYFQSWIGEHMVNLSRDSRNSAICQSPRGFAQEEVLSIINLSSTCNNENFDYLEDRAEEEDKEDLKVDVTFTDKGFLQATLSYTDFHCDRIYLYRSTHDQEDEIDSHYLSGCDEPMIMMNPSEMIPGQSYLVCVTGSSSSSSTTSFKDGWSLVRGCSDPFIWTGNVRKRPQLSTFSAQILDAGTLQIRYEVTSLIDDGSIDDCGLWVLIQREGQTLTAKLLNCNGSLYIFDSIPEYPEYKVCYALKFRDYESADMMDGCIDPVTTTLLSRSMTRSSTAVLPLALTLVFLAVGTAALAVLYLIIRGYLSDQRNASFFHRSGVKPPLASLFHCCYCSGGKPVQAQTSPRSSALYLNVEDEEF